MRIRHQGRQSNNTGQTIDNSTDKRLYRNSIIIQTKTNCMALTRYSTKRPCHALLCAWVSSSAKSDGASQWTQRLPRKRTKRYIFPICPLLIRSSRFQKNPLSHPVRNYPSRFIFWEGSLRITDRNSATQIHEF